MALAALQPFSANPLAEFSRFRTERPFHVALDDGGLKADGPAAAGSRDASPALGPAILPASRYYTSRELDGIPGPLAQIDPEYPESAARRHLGGKVVVRLFIDEAGRVERVLTLRADPPGYFENSVQRAFGAARFTPGIRNGRPVKSQLTLAVSFDTPPPPPIPGGG
jgi:TonB family protein